MSKYTVMNALHGPSLNAKELLDRRELLTRGALFLGATLLSGCSAGRPAVTASETNTPDEALIRASEAFKVRTAKSSNDPYYRASGAVFSVGSDNQVNLGSIFPFVDTNGTLKLGSVGHVVNNIQRSRVNSCWFDGVNKLLAISSDSEINSNNPNSEDPFTSIVPSDQIEEVFESAFESGVLGKLTITQTQPNIGDQLRYANTRLGKFIDVFYGGPVQEYGITRPTLYVKTAVEALDLLPTNQDEYTRFVDTISAGGTGLEAYIDEFICSGDSGTPILNTANEIVGVMQSIGLNRQNENGQLCSPIVRIS